MTKLGKTLVGILIAVLVIIIGRAAYKKPAEPVSTAPASSSETATPTPIPSTEPIKLGFIGPLTGDAAIYGEPARAIVEMAVAEINATGGVNGQPLQVIYEDGKCSGKDAASAMQKLVNADNVQAVIGGFCSSESLAAEPIATQNKVLLFSPGSSSPDLTGKSQFFARDYPSDASQGQVLADIAYSDKGWKKIAFIQEQLDYPLGIYKAFHAEFTKLGGTVTKEEFPKETTDFRSIIAKVKAGKPDALFIDTQAPAASERILKQIQELKWKPSLLFADIIDDPKILQNNAAAMEGALLAIFGTDPANAKFQTMTSSYKQKNGVDVPYQSYAQTEYDSVYILRDGLLAVGNNGEKLAVWMRSVSNWPGASGAVTIGADGDRVGGHVAKVIKNGNVELYTK